jgi:integrase
MPVGDFPPEPLSAGEVRQLLGAARDGTVAGRRNYTLLVTLWRTGLRCSEALQLRSSDVDAGAGTVRVLHGKGNRARTVGIDLAAVKVLSEWEAERESLGIVGGPLFCTVLGQAGKPLESRYVRALVARLGRKAGIEHRVHPHGLRHTHAVELRQEGWSVPFISRQLGHANIATTEVYIGSLYPAEVVELAQHREWA